MSNEIATNLKYVNLQIAAEAFYDLKNAFPGAIAVGLIREKVLTDGNDHSSKFTATQAKELVNDWTVLEHISNTATGFSGTLFKALRDAPEQGIKMGELVLSFRSTEFVDDLLYQYGEI